MSPGRRKAGPEKTFFTRLLNQRNFRPIFVLQLLDQTTQRVKPPTISPVRECESAELDSRQTRQHEDSPSPPRCDVPRWQRRVEIIVERSADDIRLSWKKVHLDLREESMEWSGVHPLMPRWSGSNSALVRRLGV
jgi:hypothetical protein